MKHSQYIANRLREVFLTGKWIANTNYKEQISGLTIDEATRKIGSFNSIASLVYHINYYLEGLLEVLNGGPLTISDRYSFDLPHMQSENDWQELIQRFLQNAEAFAVKVESLSDKQLERDFVDEKYGSYMRNIEGVLEHSYYHLGQITLLKKMIGQKNSLHQ
ncbi:MAG TPA: DinB family protein [Saprospiraceae bacterium]|nr:DinB family protein [Saprospiraceae bacterium]